MPLTPTWRSPRPFPEADAISDATPELLRRYVAADPGRPVVADAEYQITARQLIAAIAAQQRRLRAAGVRRGDLVCAQLPNWWESVAIAHAVWGLGAVLCPVPVNHRTAEIAAILTAAPPAAYLAPARYRGTEYEPLVAAAMQRAGRQVPWLAIGRGPFGAGPPADAPAGHTPAKHAPVGQALADAGDDPAGQAELSGDLDAVCMLMFTSGTTGRPKGVLHSHRSLLAEARSISDLFELARARVYMPSPIGHITGLVYGVLMPLLMDGSVVLQAGWDPEVGLRLIEEHGCTFSVGATPFLRGLTDSYRRAGRESGLAAFVCGGADVPASLVREGQRALGAVVVRAYGLTEMPTVTCGGPADPAAVQAETDGRLTGTSRARLARAVDGVGELEVCGPELCLGYLEPADTAVAFTADGWFRTGDLARLGPGGTVTIAGRAKDIIVRGGENISVKEVEDYLIDHPQITDVAIVGVPDPMLGERACAFIIAPDVAPSLADITAFLISRDIARHKIPERLLVVAELPRTPSGKIQKFVLRDRAVTALASGQGERR